MLAGAAVICGGVIALAFSGQAEHTRGVVADDTGRMALPPDEVAEEPPSGSRVIPDAIPAAPMSLASASQSISIEMYSATWCQACQAAHRWMDHEHIAYHVIDVDRQTDALAQLSMLNPRRTLPTFDVDGQVLVGFDQIALTSAIMASSTTPRRDGAGRHPR